MHDVVRGVGQQIQLTVWPEDFIISPDPPAGGGGTGPRQVAAGDVLIVAALPDPVGDLVAGAGEPLAVGRERGRRGRIAFTRVAQQS